MTRAPTRAVLALVATFAMVGAATPTLAGCASFLEAAAAAVGQHPCCAEAGIEVSAVSADCCRDGALPEVGATMAASGTGPDVPPAAAVTVPIALVANALAADAGSAAARGALERPTVSARIRAISVLLI